MLLLNFFCWIPIFPLRSIGLRHFVFVTFYIQNLIFPLSSINWKCWHNLALASFLYEKNSFSLLFIFTFPIERTVAPSKSANRFFFCVEIRQLLGTFSIIMWNVLFFFIYSKKICRILREKRHTSKENLNFVGKSRIFAKKGGISMWICLPSFNPKYFYQKCVDHFTIFWMLFVFEILFCLFV